MSNLLVSDSEVERALDWLRDNAGEIGECKRRSVKAEHMLKHVKALAMKHSGEASAAAQEREAFTSAEYLAAIDQAADAAGEYEKMKALREAASLKIEVYRSSSANYRAMKI